jgi:DnaK suppressor protein
MASSAKKKAVVSKKVAAKPAKKPVVKTAAKPAAKKVAKPAPKAPAKPVAKVAAKPAAKVATKTAAKSAPKAPVKVAAKPVKPVAPAPKAVAAKPTTKITAAPAAKTAPVKAAPTPAPAPVPVPVKPVTSSLNTVPKTNTATTVATPPKAVVLSMNAHKKYAGITEAEILKQPESEYMSKTQLAFFKEKLTELRSTIIHNATDTGEHLRDVEVATDPSDRATQEEEYTLELRTRDRERKLLKKVDKVLRMIDDGSFGWCEETGEPIGLPRLIARPTATLSIEAQERRERKQKLFGD